MPIHYARKPTGSQRSADGNRHLGVLLCFVAGAINAGGFLAVRQYTSHLTGIVSAMADGLALGAYKLVLPGLGALLSFVAGAACSAIMVNYARRRKMHGEYALPLLLEAVLLLGFGVLGARLAGVAGLFVPLTVMMLCFIMGLQNALITKVSKAEIRTTHITGIVTDIGIEVGKMLYWNGAPQPGRHEVRANHERLRLLVALVSAFFAGGVTGALGFQAIGYSATVPLALLLVALAIVPAMDDLMARASAK
ncbi:YoaK family protein [Pseudoduganella sp. UC29_71]|uniref:YoaK family protein n=1 Tax=Pseudoduganella sp. UC29_71 TaxID=3350174 RepID=UPI00366BBAB8